MLRIAIFESVVVDVERRRFLDGKITGNSVMFLRPSAIPAEWSWRC
jgi:hypothetical protein